ncbi:MAG: hypothetical protein K0U61_02605 [Alphaproteobacteria bacterium]|nr:hypothetical protein [Alphaproteobacteria bacterium]
MTHTPGPWDAEKHANGCVFVSGLHAKTGDICDLYHRDSEGEIVVKHNAESNAHLIAAAPEMYDALIAVERTLRGNDLYDLRKVDFALAKARGEHE